MTINSILDKYRKGTYKGEYPTVSKTDFESLKKFEKDKVKVELAKLLLAN